jgi:hypothetical protein
MRDITSNCIGRQPDRGILLAPWIDQHDTDKEGEHFDKEGAALSSVQMNCGVRRHGHIQHQEKQRDYEA